MSEKSKKILLIISYHFVDEKKVWLFFQCVNEQSHRNRRHVFFCHDAFSFSKTKQCSFRYLNRPFLRIRAVKAGTRRRFFVLRIFFFNCDIAYLRQGNILQKYPRESILCTFISEFQSSRKISFAKLNQKFIFKNLF